MLLWIVEIITEKVIIMFYFHEFLLSNISENLQSHLLSILLYTLVVY